MTQVTFWLMEDGQQAVDAHGLFALACEVAAHCYRNRQRCYVLCDDKQAAEDFDEKLWQLPTESFIPHNLSGEGPVNGAPVEICWQVPTQVARPVLINLSKQMVETPQRYKQIFDFVPAEDALKQLARERYKQYRAVGCQLDTRPASSINES